MFVAEAPGYSEDRTGSLFVGEVGALFDELLASISLRRDQVYVTSVVKCRPPRNRASHREEVLQCEGYLYRQIALVRPQLICTMGGPATKLLTGLGGRFVDMRGQVLSCVVQGRSVAVLPMYHPAAAMYVGDLLGDLRSDMLAIPALVRGAVEGVTEGLLGSQISIESAPGKLAVGIGVDTATEDDACGNQLSFELS